MKQVVSVRTGTTRRVDKTARDEAQAVVDAAKSAAEKTPEAKRTRIQDALNLLFTAQDPEERLIGRIIYEMSIDIAALKSVTPRDYWTDLFNRIKP